VLENGAFLDGLPFDGLAVYARSTDLSKNVTAAVLGATRLEERVIRDILAPLRGLRFGNLTENFVAVVGGRPPDFFDDWSGPAGNFAALARAAREVGLRGVYFDNETYDAPWSRWPQGVRHGDRSLAEYQAQARLRGREVMEAMVEAFPEIVVILLHGPYISEPRAPAPLFPQWQSRNQLLGPFFAGFVEGAGPRSSVVDGGELYHLRSSDEFRDSYGWRKDAMGSDAVDCAFLPAALRARWKDRVSVGFGVFDRPFKGQRMDPGTLRTTLVRALRQTDRYVWLYVEGPSFLKPPGRGGASAEWVEAVRQARGNAGKAPPE